MTIEMKPDERVRRAFSMERVIADMGTPDRTAQELFQARALLAHVLDALHEDHASEQAHDESVCWYCHASALVYGEDVPACDDEASVL